MEVRKLHDCSTCQVAGTCGIESKVRWIEEHIEEVEDSLATEQENILKVISCALLADTTLLLANPTVVNPTEFSRGCIAQAFTLGYYCGVNKIPQAFKVLDEEK